MSNSELQEMARKNITRELAFAEKKAKRKEQVVKRGIQKAKRKEQANSIGNLCPELKGLF